MSRDLLVEIGTEELPPKALASLIDSFADSVGRQLDEAVRFRLVETHPLGGDVLHRWRCDRA